MILLITEVNSDLTLASNVRIATFKVVDGEPSLKDIERLLRLELNNILAVSYNSQEKIGSFFDKNADCYKGMHFNAQEHPEHFAT